MISPHTRRRARVDAVVAAYMQWRSERDAVRATYRGWIAASASTEPLAFHAYRTALDREERAAKTYAELMSHALATLGKPVSPTSWRAHRLSSDGASAMSTAALRRPHSLPKGGALSPRTAFVLSGGASLGAIQVGMLEALYERGIALDFRSAPLSALSTPPSSHRPPSPRRQRGS